VEELNLWQKPLSHKEDNMQPTQIKALEPEQSVLKFLDGVIADYGVYIFMGLVFLLIPFLAWLLSGGFRRKQLKGNAAQRNRRPATSSSNTTQRARSNKDSARTWKI
jgi:hypothetical protein